jgi:hypothetical protein
MLEKHTAADCPVGNEKALKASMALTAKMPELLKKYGIKPIGMWSVHNEHLNVAVWDAPSVEAVEKMGMEPEVLAWRCFSTAEVKVAAPMEEVAQRMLARSQSK